MKPLLHTVNGRLVEQVADLPDHIQAVRDKLLAG